MPGQAAPPSGQQEPQSDSREVINNPATGDPTVNGTPQVGRTLTADTSGIDDQDGRDQANFAYWWLANGAGIDDASGSSYTPGAADAGRSIRVLVSFTDDAGNREARVSEATEDVEAAPNSPATGAPTISGTAQVGETLAADTSGIADGNGLDNATFSYQWLADEKDIAGASGSTYTLADTDEGKTLRVRVSFTDDGGNQETLTSAATDAVAARPNTPATGAPSIRGTAQVGQTLTADTSGIADKDGLDNATFNYQWLADDTDISGATGSSYTLADADEGKAVRVQVSFTDDAGNSEELTSDATAAVAPAPDGDAFWSAAGSHGRGVGLPGLRILLHRFQESRFPHPGLVRGGRRGLHSDHDRGE